MFTRILAAIAWTGFIGMFASMAVTNIRNPLPYTEGFEIGWWFYLLMCSAAWVFGIKIALFGRE